MIDQDMFGVQIMLTLLTNTNTNTNSFGKGVCFQRPPEEWGMLI